jgi:hypothetical protein
MFNTKATCSSSMPTTLRVFKCGIAVVFDKVRMQPFRNDSVVNHKSAR